MKPNLSLLKQVLNLPTAPFHENYVIQFIQDFCKRLALPLEKDRFGNLKIIYKRAKKGKPIALLAHMDHPGFEIIEGGEKPVAKLLGGVPDPFFLNARVLVWQNGRGFPGVVKKVKDKKKRQFVIACTRQVSKGGFGYFDLAPFKIQNGFIFTKAADNLVSVALLLNFLEGLVKQKVKGDILCLFTRAEEVGFIGTSGLIQKGFLSKKIPILVLEASSAKVGKVDIGGGPVLRVGDRISTFSHSIDLWLQETALTIKKRKKGFMFQRALLSGGRCEATVFTEKGYQTGCLALPLGNYHNAGEKTYAMEYISLRDYQNMLEWLFALAKGGAPKNISKLSRDIDRIFKKYAPRLENIS